MATSLLKDFDTKKTAVAQAEENFIDVDLKFTRNPITNDVSIKKGNRAIAQAIKTIVLTNPGDLPYEPDFGVGVNSLLGENNDPISILTIKDRIYDQITRYEVRVEVSAVEVETDDHSVYIRVYYVVKNDPAEQTVDVKVGRVL